MHMVLTINSVGMFLKSLSFMSSNPLDAFIPILDPWQSRQAPNFGSERFGSDNKQPDYVITPARLEEIRAQKMYPFFDKVFIAMFVQ